MQLENRRRVMVQDVHRSLHILLAHAIVTLDEWHLGRMDGGLPQQAVVQVLFTWPNGVS